MAKLYPPIIEKVIPAFYGDSITVPFQLNRTVGRADFTSIKLKIMSTTTNKILLESKTSDIQLIADNYYSATFKDLDSTKITMGNFYKIQICFVQSGQEGYYSTVGVVKYTGKPSVKLTDVFHYKGIGIGYITQEMKGSYSNQDDTEKAISYQFVLYDRQGNLLSSSGEQYLSQSDNEQYYWYCDYTLQTGKQYQVEFSVNTINALNVSSGKVDVILQDTIAITPSFDYQAKYYPEDGYATVEIKSKIKSSGAPTILNNRIIISRSSSKDNYFQETKLWEGELKGWASLSFKPIFKDFTLEHGYDYKYIFQIVNDYGLCSNKTYSNSITANHEDAFLFDGQKQLKLKFNPKISSFKNTLLEQKQDTIGGPYPYFFRNANVKYKEFPISGLISMLMDDNACFIEGEEKDKLVRSQTPSRDNIDNKSLTNLSDSNYQLEREFKLRVLEWLTDGKPKLFRSPQEGNYIVRLMNTSLSPNDTLGRMLHTFSCTAYEIADGNKWSNYLSYGFFDNNSSILSDQPIINVRNINMSNATYWREWLMSGENDSIIVSNYITNKIVFAFIRNCKPGTGFKYTIGNEQYNGSIGSTGEFYIPKELFGQAISNYFEIAKTSGSVWKADDYNAELIVGYASGTLPEEFENMTSITLNPIIQYRTRVCHSLSSKWGTDFEICEADGQELLTSDNVLAYFDPVRTNPYKATNENDDEIKNIYYNSHKYWNLLRANYLEDLRKKVGYVYYLRLSAMPTRIIYYSPENKAWYLDSAKSTKLEGNAQSDCLYIGNYNNITYWYWVNNLGTGLEYRTTSGPWAKGKEAYYCKLVIGNEITEYDFTPQNIRSSSMRSDLPLRTEGDIILHDISNLTSLIITPGVKVEILYQEKEIYYNFETSLSTLKRYGMARNSILNSYPQDMTQPIDEYGEEYYKYYSNYLYPLWYQNVYILQKDQAENKAPHFNCISNNYLRRPQGPKPGGIRVSFGEKDSYSLLECNDYLEYQRVNYQGDYYQSMTDLRSGDKLLGCPALNNQVIIYSAMPLQPANYQMIVYIYCKQAMAIHIGAANELINELHYGLSAGWNRIQIDLKLDKALTNQAQFIITANDAFCFWKPQLYKVNHEDDTPREECLAWHSLQ